MYVGKTEEVEAIFNFINLIFQTMHRAMSTIKALMQQHCPSTQNESHMTCNSVCAKTTHHLKALNFYTLQIVMISG